MKTAIVYYSKHHGNTKKLLDAIAQKREVTLLDITENPDIDLRAYDRIGFASGIYYSKFQKSVLKCAEEKLPEGKEVFFIYTYSVERKGYTDAIQKIVEKKNSRILGSFGCLGFNTFGPFKIIGGLAKNHPDQDDLARAVIFYKGL